MCRSLHKTSFILDAMRTGRDWPVVSHNRTSYRAPGDRSCPYKEKDPHRFLDEGQVDSCCGLTLRRPIRYATGYTPDGHIVPKVSGASAP